ATAMAPATPQMGTLTRESAEAGAVQDQNGDPRRIDLADDVRRGLLILDAADTCPLNRKFHVATRRAMHPERHPLLQVSVYFLIGSGYEIRLPLPLEQLLMQVGRRTGQIGRRPSRRPPRKRHGSQHSGRSQRPAEQEAATPRNLPLANPGSVQDVFPQLWRRLARSEALGKRFLEAFLVREPLGAGRAHAEVIADAEV